MWFHKCWHQWYFVLTYLVSLPFLDQKASGVLLSGFFFLLYRFVTNILLVPCCYLFGFCLALWQKCFWYSVLTYFVSVPLCDQNKFGALLLTIWFMYRFVTKMLLVCCCYIFCFCKVLWPNCLWCSPLLLPWRSLTNAAVSFASGVATSPWIALQAPSVTGGRHIHRRIDWWLTLGMESTLHLQYQRCPMVLPFVQGVHIVAVPWWWSTDQWAMQSWTLPLPIWMAWPLLWTRRPLERILEWECCVVCVHFDYEKKSISYCVVMCRIFFRTHSVLSSFYAYQTCMCTLLVSNLLCDQSQ